MNYMENNFERQAESVAAIMYSMSDCDDDTTWLSSDNFHDVAEKILVFIYNTTKEVQEG